jgi:Spy/CpxP family protein refolding chaperone
MKSRVKLWIALSLVAVFLAGVLGGILCERHLLPKKWERTRRDAPPPFHSLDEMARELKLTPEQKEKIREIFKKNEERLKALRTKVDSDLAEIRTQIKNEIDSVLTTEQIQKLEALIAKHMASRKQRDEKHRDRPRSDQGEKTKGERE